MWLSVLVRWLCVLSAADVVLAAPIEAGSSDLSGSSSELLDLTPSDFSSLTGTYFVKMFSPMCTHCKALAPKWEAAYEATHASSSLKWANLDCIRFGDFCAAEDVHAFPTLRIYRDGKRIYDYTNSGASEDDLKVFALEYAKRGDDAFAEVYEKATAELLKDVLESNVEASYDASQDELHAAAADASVATPDESAGKAGDSVAAADAPAAAAPASAPGSVVLNLGPNDFGLDKNVGRWFVLFVGPSCTECDALSQKWERHEYFARDILEINWGRVDCSVDSALCEAEAISQVPAMRIYQDGKLMYEYTGARDTMSLRTFLKRAAVLSNFDGFSLTDLDVSAVGFDGKPLPEGAGPNQEPNYMSGPSVPKPEHKGKGKPSIADVVKYTLDTLGQPIDDDPGLLIFGESPERHHNFRNWGAPNAQPPAYFAEGTAASYSQGMVKELKGTELEEIVKSSGEPWFVKFYSPKCPHCQSLAPIFTEFASKTKGQLNAGAVNCEINAKLCEAEKITHYPYMKYYRGPVALEEYEGPRTVEGLTNYAVKVSKAQIMPISSPEDLTAEILNNFDNNLTTFVYLYDESVMTEDWESLAKVAISIAEWGGKLYRSDNNDLRELAGIKHRGTAFVLVDVIDTELKWYDFPLSSIPAKIRDSDLVSLWARRSKWSQLQPLSPFDQSDYAPYVAVKLTKGETPIHTDPLVREHKILASDFRDFYQERQIQDQDRMRIDRLRQHDEALLQSRFKYALELMKQKLDAPFIADLAFAHIPLRKWQLEYSKYMDTSRNEAGDVVFVDFYHGVYVDEFNLTPIKDDREVFEDLVKFLHRYEAHDSKAVFSSIRHFKSKMSNVPESVHRSQKFHPEALRHNNGWRLGYAMTAIKILGGFSAIYIVYRTFVRSYLRAYTEKRGYNHGRESSLLPKQE